MSQEQDAKQQFIKELESLIRQKIPPLNYARVCQDFKEYQYPDPDDQDKISSTKMLYLLLLILRCNIISICEAKFASKFHSLMNKELQVIYHDIYWRLIDSKVMQSIDEKIKQERERVYKIFLIQDSQLRISEIQQICKSYYLEIDIQDILAMPKEEKDKKIKKIVKEIQTKITTKKLQQQRNQILPKIQANISYGASEDTIVALYDIVEEEITEKLRSNYAPLERDAAEFMREELYLPEGKKIHRDLRLIEQLISLDKYRLEKQVINISFDFQELNQSSIPGLSQILSFVDEKQRQSIQEIIDFLQDGEDENEEDEAEDNYEDEIEDNEDE